MFAFPLSTVATTGSAQCFCHQHASLVKMNSAKEADTQSDKTAEQTCVFVCVESGGELRVE